MTLPTAQYNYSRHVSHPEPPPPLTFFIFLQMFEELADYRAFELLRSHSARSDYLLTKQARIIAMTCTHAALIRRRLVELGFKYDNMVMEESAQILEVETFIPMMLQVI